MCFCNIHNNKMNKSSDAKLKVSESSTQTFAHSMSLAICMSLRLRPHDPLARLRKCFTHRSGATPRLLFAFESDPISDSRQSSHDCGLDPIGRRVKRLRRYRFTLRQNFHPYPPSAHFKHFSQIDALALKTNKNFQQLPQTQFCSLDSVRPAVVSNTGRMQTVYP